MVKTDKSLAGVYETWKNQALLVRKLCDNTLTNSNIYSLMTSLYSSLSTAAELFNNPPSGLAAWAREQEDEAAYDVVSEFSALRTQINLLITFIQNNAPTFTDAGDIFLKTHTFNSDEVEDFELTTAQQTALNIRLNNVIALVALPGEWTE